MDLDVGALVTHDIYGDGVIKDKFKNGEVIFKIVFNKIDHPLFLIHSEVRKSNG
jgi:hypothetical protein|tara:strand:+ start:4146 stop:4307 length:162 start_codon:yes stop_codon:yes gene_type:complete